MNEDFITYELAVKLKEKGFKEKCYKHYYPGSKDWFISSSPECGNYSSYLDAPTISQVLKWLRGEKNIICLPHIDPFKENWFFYVVILPQSSDFPEYMSSIIYNTYEQAALAGIEYVLNNLI